MKIIKGKQIAAFKHQHTTEKAIIMTVVDNPQPDNRKTERNFKKASPG